MSFFCDGGVLVRARFLCVEEAGSGSSVRVRRLPRGIVTHRAPLDLYEDRQFWSGQVRRPLSGFTGVTRCRGTRGSGSPSLLLFRTQRTSLGPYLSDPGFSGRDRGPTSVCSDNGSPTRRGRSAPDFETPDTHPVRDPTPDVPSPGSTSYRPPFVPFRGTSPTSD